MLAIDLSRMSANRLAELYVALSLIGRRFDALAVYNAGIVNCGEDEFAKEIEIASRMVKS